MFAQSRIVLALALALFAAARTGHAAVILRGTEFAPLQPVSGQSGRTVAVRAVLYGKWYDTVTRKSSLRPFSGATITFEAYRKTHKNGNGLTDWGPIGRVVKTDVNGVATTTYKLPSGAGKKLNGHYRATFAGGVFDGVLLPKNTSRSGDVIIRP